MTVTQFVVAVIYTASLTIPMPEFYRHTKARQELVRMLRGCR